MSLSDLSTRTGLAYTHLSRIENDSTVPGPDTVVKLAGALGGDLKVMLELAACLPRAILDRIAADAIAGESRSLPRSAYGMSQSPYRDSPPLDLARDRAIALEASELEEAMSLLPKMKPHHQRAIVGLIRTLYHEGDEPSG